MTSLTPAYSAVDTAWECFAPRSQSRAECGTTSRQFVKYGADRIINLQCAHVAGCPVIDNEKKSYNQAKNFVPGLTKNQALDTLSFAWLIHSH